ncbi:alpha-L-fucosidase [Joostella atrarenae]|uniref:alpha-L-fucosidase n=1 Tax=Joostella atrarenae TaxID=679257 RepID=A0ABS9J757_9FLAO|nr:alpha-L-fucosidase [Joostella atrarenae]MCF8716235.1 alpha-L-fucosidase [Joostella atrarenae]
MKYINRFILCSICAFSLLSCGNESKKTSKDEGLKNETSETGKVVFEPNWESIKKNYKDPEWFNNNKFGIFIHWGAYSVPAYGSEWYPRQMYMDTATFTAQLNLEKKGPNNTYLYHKKTWGDQKEFGYKDFIPMFKAEKFDPKEWITLFKKAGAKYVIPVADHHDGFAMYDAKTTKWNSVNMGPKRDVLGELFKEGREQGLIMGASSHYAFNWSFYNKKDKFDTTDPKYADLYSPKGKDINEPVSDEFKEMWWERTTDLIDNYKPDILWFDFYLDISDYADLRPKIAAYYYNKGIEWGKEVVINDKNFDHEAFPEGTVVYDLERGKLPGIRKLPWQTDTSIGKNSWSYVTDWESKSTNQLIDDLVDVVSKNGNLLLNVGPKSDGTIPNDQKEILLQIGHWLDVNGEAIYNTKYWKTFGEGPTKVKKGHHSEKNNVPFTGHDIRFTSSNNNLYATLMAWPTEKDITIKSIADYDLKIKNVTMLGSSEKINWELKETGVKVELPSKKPTDYAHVFKIELQ